MRAPETRTHAYSRERAVLQMEKEHTAEQKESGDIKEKLSMPKPGRSVPSGEHGRCGFRASGRGPVGVRGRRRPGSPGGGLAQ